MNINLKTIDFSPFCKHSAIPVIWDLNIYMHMYTYLYCLQASKSCFRSVTYKVPRSVLAPSKVPS